MDGGGGRRFSVSESGGAALRTLRCQGGGTLTLSHSPTTPLHPFLHSHPDAPALHRPLPLSSHLSALPPSNRLPRHPPPPPHRQLLPLLPLLFNLFILHLERAEGLGFSSHGCRRSSRLPHRRASDCRGTGVGPQTAEQKDTPVGSGIFLPGVHVQLCRHL